MTSTLSSSIKIAVAGGFSAGKSSLLNSLTQIGNMLPTGVEPVSVVNTYLNCQSDIQKPIIRGKNLKDEFVQLNEEVLACIQHSSKSKTYVAPVLDRIIINIPSEKYLNGITFVDTPGYNNSTSSAESDQDKAIKAMKECDAIFWCVDIEAGTLTKNDLKILKEIIDKPIVIFYTKMDKKSIEQVKKIVHDSEKVWLKEFGQTQMPVSIMAISCVNKQKYSSNHITFRDIIENIKKQCGFTNLLTRYKKEVEELFDKELEASTNALEDYEEQRKEQIKDKNEWYELYRDNKEYAQKYYTANQEAIENIEGSFALPAEIFGSRDLMLLKADGMSMKNVGIEDGDYIIIRRQETADSGDMVLALLGNEATVKTYYPQKNGKIVLHPENEQYQDIVVEDCMIQGIVVGCLKRYR